MAYEQNPYAIKITAVPDASGASVVAGSSVYLQTQFTFVKLASASISSYNESGNVVTACTAITDRPLGVLQNQPKVWFDANGNIEGVSEAEVTVSGITKVKAGGTITVGDALGITLAGLAKTIVGGTDTTQYILGTALSSGVSGDIITMVVSAGAAARAA
jgi:hypothetical protein